MILPVRIFARACECSGTGRDRPMVLCIGGPLHRPKPSRGHGRSAARTKAAGSGRGVRERRLGALAGRDGGSISEPQRGWMKTRGTFLEGANTSPQKSRPAGVMPALVAGIHEHRPQQSGTIGGHGLPGLILGSSPRTAMTARGSQSLRALVERADIASKVVQ
jgi:hypothetical protein